MNWSHYQQAIFDAFEHGTDSLLIEAVAGSGKTTVLVELARIMQRAFPERRGVFLAFNKSIATTLQEKLAGIGNVRAMTLHSAGWAAWRRAGGLEWTPQLNQHKTSDIIRKLMTWEERKKWEEGTRKLVGFAKGIGIVPGVHVLDWRENGIENGLVEDTPEAWESLIDHYNLDEDDCNIDLARKVLARSIELAREECDYDDMLYMPVVAGVPFDSYDVVLVDEAQDVSAIQREMIERMAEGRVICCGDRFQSIFGFRGAGTNSMDMLQEHFNLKPLPLSVTYRCPQAVVKHARQWVSHLEWREGAPEGVVLGEETNWDAPVHIFPLGTPCVDCGCPAKVGTYSGNHAYFYLCSHCDMGCNYGDGISKWRGLSDFRPGDAILCRLNRPLIETAFALIRKRIPARVLGRDIGQGLAALVKKPKFDGGRPVSDWQAWAQEYILREMVKLKEKRQFAKLGQFLDRMATIEVFIEDLRSNAIPEHGEPDIADLLALIDEVFREREPEGMVTLSTIHKAKGLEWNRVFILDAGELMPCPWARDGWEMEQEWHCCYIAATRAKSELRYITSKSLGLERD